MLGLRELCSDRSELPKEVLDWITHENLWNLWVPESHGGLGRSLTQGLGELRSLAQVDGSLGWTVTLCSGANFFVGNLQPEVAVEVFLRSGGPVCLGGSGGVSGKAEKKGEGFQVSGTWRYATGAPYLSHFTLNAELWENGKPMVHEDGTPLFRSFLLKREKVEIIRDWKSMGLKATATHSFSVDAQWVHARYGFQYNDPILPQPIFKVDFAVFSDFTLWANYLGMAARFLEEAIKMVDRSVLKGLSNRVDRDDALLLDLARRTDAHIQAGHRVPGASQREIHQRATESVRTLSAEIIGAYPGLGIRASRMDHPLNQAFRDYFTATQHPIFHPRKG